MNGGPAVPPDVGTRLRDVRVANALSQRALAKSAGISNATISLIESGKLNPSVAMLKRILDGILSEIRTARDSQARGIPAICPVGNHIVEFRLRWCANGI